MLSQLQNTCQILYQSLPLRKSCTDAAISPTTFSRIVRTTTTRATHEFQQQRSNSKNRQYHHSSCNTGKVSWSSTRMTLMSRSFQINYVTSTTTTIRTAALTTTSTMHDRTPILEKMVGISLQASAGCLKNQPSITSIQSTPHIHGGSSSIYEPRNPVVAVVGHPKRVLVLCTGGTMTMVPDTKNQNALTPQQGALSYYIQHHMVPELYYQYEGNHAMPEIVLHEYNPFLDSSDLGPDEFANVAQDIYTNYSAFDGFVVVTGTDTMAYFATSLSFMFEHLNKPIVFTGSQIPLCYPYNDARHNLIMAILFASRGGGGGIDEQKNTGTSTNAAKATTVVPAIHEVTIFFHDRLLRANRSTKINTHQLMAFDSPNMKPLATIGISIQDNVELFLPQNNNNVPVQLHTQFDTRVLTLRLIPGFDDAMIRHMIERNISEQLLKGLVLQLYGTGNMPSLKKSFIDLLSYAKHQCGIVIVATTQCMTGSVQFGNYAVGTVMEQQAGVVSAYDMTMEATVCKLAYLLGRSETSTTTQQVDTLMSTSLRGEMTNQSMSSTRLK